VATASTWVTPAANAWSIPIPAEVADGDFGILVISLDPLTSTVITVSGWTMVKGQFSAGSANLSSYVFTKIKASGDTTVSITLANTRTGTATAFWLRGFTAITQTGTYGIRSGTIATVTAPGITTTDYAKQLIALFADRSSSAVGEGDAITALSWGQVVAQGDSNPAWGTPTTAIPTHWLVMYKQSAIGASGDNTVTMMDTADGAWGVVMSLSPVSDLWVWNGTAEIPANVTYWYGSSELESGITFT
jgi:hypothetical protein